MSTRHLVLQTSLDSVNGLARVRQLILRTSDKTDLEGARLFGYFFGNEKSNIKRCKDLSLKTKDNL